jgi:hypothetical protein
MGIERENGAYSATVEGYLIVGQQQIQLAKSNAESLVFAEPRELPPGTSGELRIIVDGQVDACQVVLPDGAAAGQWDVGYEVVAPF